ncbi:MAG: glucose-6-phosphate isomerase, partial [Clostridia bacterium]|nr:glucose-6-phosphate isomerase [Clostridia bacterium]
MQNIHLNYTNMMKPSNSGGFDEAFLSKQAAIAAEAMRTWRVWRVQREQIDTGWTELPYNQSAVVDEIEKYAAWAQEKFEALVIFGIGGSSLGPLAVHQALNHFHYNELPSTKIKFYVEENIDPERMAALFDVIDPAKTLFNVVSKSGKTAETLSQFMIIRDVLSKRLPQGHQDHIVCTSEADSPLADCACSSGYRLFVIPDGVGGRFSELCPVGLVPAAICGIDIRELLKGAAAADARCLGEDLRQNPALLAAVLQTEAARQGRNISVMMPYADRLRMT